MIEPDGLRQVFIGPGVTVKEEKREGDHADTEGDDRRKGYIKKNLVPVQVLYDSRP
jgi:hypothetical protein